MKFLRLLCAISKVTCQNTRNTRIFKSNLIRKDFVTLGVHLVEMAVRSNLRDGGKE